MKKILIGILVLLIVAMVTLAIIFKSDTGENTSQSQDLTSHTLSGEADNIQPENNDNSPQKPQNAHSQDNDTASNSDKQNGLASSDKNGKNNAQSSKIYNLSGSEILQSQRSSFGDVKLISAKDNNKKIYLIEASVENKKFYYELPGHYIIENIYCANIDGISGDELIIHSDTGKNNVYDNVVLKITKKGLQTLFSKQQATEFMATYSSILKNDFNVEITNSYTNLKKTINVNGINEENYCDSFWEFDGSLAVVEVKDRVLFEETYYTFKPSDIDNDGFYEVVCSQKASLGSIDSLIGYAQTTLKFNHDTNKFKIIKTEFFTEIN